jgi:hypothetical protein
MAMVEYGGDFVQTYPFDLNQNLICIGIGVLELIIGFVVKKLPLKFFQCVSLDEKPMSESELT